MIDRALLYVGNDGALRLAPPLGHTYREVKQQIGASWDDQADAWKFPALRSNVVQAIEAFGDDLDLSEQVKEMGDGYGFKPAIVAHRRFTDLYPYQQRAAEYLVGNPHGTLLNMSPGLGKTAVSIVAAQASLLFPCLIVAPASLLYTWQREIKAWSGEDALIAHGTNPQIGGGFTITSYDTVVRHPDWFDVVKWRLLVIDESVLIKNRTTKRYKALDALRQKVPKVWMLSGSPTTRYADDLWTQMHLAWPVAFSSYWRFAERFCVFEANIWSKTGKEIVGTRESRDLTWELGDVMLTVNQEDPDVLPDLPEYLYQTVDVELTPRQKQAYREMLKDFLTELGGKEVTADNKLAQLIRLQQITSGLANFSGLLTDSAKADALIELIESQAFKFPAIVWTHWHGGAEDLTHRLRARQINADWVSGSSLTRTRDRQFEAYRIGATDVLVRSLGVGKFGHTLTNTRTVVYLDKTRAADDYIQSLRRVRRIGLTWRPLLLTLRAPGTVDDLLEDNLSGKMPSLAKISNAQLKELLKGLGL